MKGFSSLIKLIAILACLGSTLTACGGGTEDSPDYGSQGATSVTLSAQSLTADASAQTMTLDITADADWGIRSEADWATVSPSGGSRDVKTSIRISLQPNTGIDTRSTLLNITSGFKVVKSVEITQEAEPKAQISIPSITFGGQASSRDITITANTSWTLSSDADWLSVSPSAGGKGETTVSVSVKSNDGASQRDATLTLLYASQILTIPVGQLSDIVTAPEGYTLVWADEFNTGDVPGADWVKEEWAPGHVNNELQSYTSKTIDGLRTLCVSDGFLHITCFKASDGKIYSGRMNARPATGWLYGYFEARIALPKGRGTWPAFWMMPSNVDWSTNPWPSCGEIDIMEEVGANPDYVSSSLHTGNYNHTIGTQRTHEMHLPGAEGSFHVYACEWTEDEIITYVDGIVQLRASRASMGTSHADWPFTYPFYPILNLAWGGDWGGYKGIDETALPATMLVDYVRIFQRQ